ncbi:MAG: SPFH domain-containing protein [Planctomycetes bacterium]|jgi:regulator of protease activity HflC (stomatin/prohibitin superfamily)|nr:SPFH domain-containing protein [Planctomycetota bacterium]
MKITEWLKGFTNGQLWAIYFSWCGLRILLIALFSCILYFELQSLGSWRYSFLILGSLLLLIIVISALRVFNSSRTDISHDRFAVLEIAGKYHSTLDGGIYWIFPLWGITEIVFSRTYHEREIILFPDTEIDFQDTTAEGVSACVRYRIPRGASSDGLSYAAKAWYVNKSYERVIKDLCESVLRIHFGKNDMDNVIQLKMNLTDLLKEDVDYIENLKEKLGVEILEILLQDVKLSEEQKAMRDVVYKSKQSAEAEQARNAELVAKNKNTKEEIEIERQHIKIDAEKKVTMAEAEAEADKKIATGKRALIAAQGEGLADQIKALKDNGLSEDDIANIVVTNIKYTNLSDKAVIFEGGSTAINGAQFGAGFNAQSKQNEKESKN